MRNSLVRRPDALLDTFFNDDFFLPRFSYGNNIDIYHEDGKYVVDINLPGFNKDDIHVDFTNDILSIRAEHKEEEKEEKRNYFYRSRSVSAYNREIRFADVDAKAIDASYENGVLKISLPEAKKRSRNHQSH